MIKLVTLTWNYTISDPLTDQKLTIAIASPQSGGSSFLNFDGEYVTSPVNSKLLGKGGDLKGKKLIVNTTVSDVDSSSNLTKVTYTINNIQQTFQDTVDQNNGTISYNITINFI